MAQNNHTADRRPQSALLELLAYFTLEIELAVNADGFIDLAVFLHQDTLVKLNRAGSRQGELFLDPRRAQAAGNADAATDVVLVAGRERLGHTDRLNFLRIRRQRGG